MIELILAHYTGAIDTPTLHDQLKQRDNAFQLELEASHYLHHITTDLVDIFGEACFILTVRDPLSWIASEVNQNVITKDPRFAIWQKLEAFRYERYGAGWKVQETGLKALPNVWPIEAYFKYWAEHILTVLEQIPTDRLLITPMWEIGQMGDRIADILGPHFPANSLDISRAHGGRGRKLVDLYSIVDRDFVQETSRKYCGDAVRRLREYIPSFNHDGHQ